MVLGVAGFVIEMPTDPLRDLVMHAHRTERAPVEENQATAALHLPFDDLPVIADVKRMILLLAVRAVRG